MGWCPRGTHADSGRGSALGLPSGPLPVYWVTADCPSRPALQAHCLPHIRPEYFYPASPDSGCSVGNFFAGSSCVNAAASPWPHGLPAHAVVHMRVLAGYFNPLGNNHVPEGLWAVFKMVLHTCSFCSQPLGALPGGSLHPNSARLTLHSPSVGSAGLRSSAFTPRTQGPRLRPHGCTGTASGYSSTLYQPQALALPAVSLLHSSNPPPSHSSHRSQDTDELLPILIQKAPGAPVCLPGPISALGSQHPASASS